ncbi:uncharacterized protein BBA_10099 [Beauveria bassiana ARSEF 2860]|uniref:Uncharacterized protein n=1 Tax=Beauveria bassiana (strain ARSEF 2860) TaxID=655819 RepID=J5J272_BEAB2|nr:uncharacterized protein BBA_10099 [Beauveria bassiana ARSEF 2860]EJP60958.1 hypothetical protein BBA_10099 [Beauveria bassiana ARSEF 2860]
MTEMYQAVPFSESDMSSDSEILTSGTDDDSAGRLRDFVVDGDEGSLSEFVPGSDVASIESEQHDRRIQIYDALDSIILELVRLRDLLYEEEISAPAAGVTDT